VLTLHFERGMTGAQIIPTTGYKKSTVYDWLRMFPFRPSLKDLPRSGRPPKWDGKVKKETIKLAQGKRHRSTRRIAKIMSNEEKNMGKTTVNRVLKEGGLIPHRQSKIPLLTPLQKKKAELCCQIRSA
jgi:transposase